MQTHGWPVSCRLLQVLEMDKKEQTGCGGRGRTSFGQHMVNIFHGANQATAGVANTAFLTGKAVTSNLLSVILFARVALGKVHG